MTRLAAIVLAALVAVASVPQTVAAQTGDEEFARMAAADLLEEIALLEESRAFIADPVTTAIHAWVDDRFVDRRELLEVLNEVDSDNAANLRAATAEGWEPGPAARATLGRLPPDVLRRIAAGDRRFLDPAPWLDGAADLLIETGAPTLPGAEDRRGVILQTLEALPVGGLAGLDALADDGLAGAAAADGGERARKGPVTGERAVGGRAAIPSVDAVDEPAGVAPAMPDSAVDERDNPAGRVPDDGLPLVPIAVGLGVAVVGGTVAGIRRWARRAGRDGVRRAGGEVMPNTDPAAAAAAVLEASRRMTASLDAAVIQRIAVRAAAPMVAADAGAFVTGRGRDMRWTASTDPTAFVDDPDPDGLLGSVLETGQARCEVRRGEQRAADASWAAAPVLVAGSVVGAVVVVRSAAEPFAADELARLELLTPVTGSALAAAQAHHGAVTASEVDGLTQLKNRRRLDADLAAVSSPPSIGFAMIDVDHFKTFNDTNGHAAGDLALRLVARAISGAVRADDIVYRYGGEEFAILLHGCDDAEVAAVVERVREAVEATPVPGGEHQPAGRVTVSAGVALAETSDTEVLKARADAALYAAKAAGRNRVVCA